MQQDYYSALTSMITASARQNPRLRYMIYDVARSKLRQRDGVTGKYGHADSEQKSRELEAAIERIEADLASGVSKANLAGADLVTSIDDSAVEIIPPTRDLPPWWDGRHESVPQHPIRSTPSSVRLLLSLVGAAVFGVVIYVAFERVFHSELPPPQVQATQNSSHKTIPNRLPEIPVPSAYGVYALANGRLTELEPLPIKVADRMVAISGTISTASKTKLPTGRVRFIAFKRDLVNNAPEKVAVRVVAQVTPTSVSGRKEDDPTKIGMTDSWTIRSTSYEMKVAPVEGNPAMIIIRSAEADFSFPAGRYALILKTTAYDFSVNDPARD